MKQLCDVTFTVPFDRIGTIIEAMKGSYTEIQVKAHNGDATLTHGAPVVVSRRGGNRRRGVTTGHWALEHREKLFAAMKPDTNYHVADAALVALFADVSKSPTFVGNVMSALTRRGLLQRVSRGWYMRSDK